MTCPEPTLSRNVMDTCQLRLGCEVLSTNVKLSTIIPIIIYNNVNFLCYINGHLFDRDSLLVGSEFRVRKASFEL